MKNQNRQHSQKSTATKPIRRTTAAKNRTTTKTTPAMDGTAMRKFILRLHGTGKAWYQTYSSNPRLKHKSKSFSAKPNHMLRDRLEKANKMGMNISVVISTCTGNSRSARNVTGIHAVFIDCDDGRTTVKQLRALSVPPHICVATSPGRLHAYWLVTDCPVTQFRAVQSALARRFKSDTAVTDAARVMRLPGSINWKYDEPFLAHVMFERADKPVRLDELVQALALDVDLIGPEDAQVDASKKADPERADTAPVRRGGTNAEYIRNTLSGVPAHDRLLWLRVGMAIHSAMPDATGLGLWTDWSRTSDKYDAEDQTTTWAGFQSHRGITLASIPWLTKSIKLHSPLDDMEAARLFAQNFRREIRFDHKGGIWYCFNGVGWDQDKQAPMRLVRSLITDLSAGDGRKDAALNRFRSHTGMKAIVNLAELEPALQISELDFDPSPDLLAVKNGVIDLPTGRFRKAKAKDFLRRCADVEYDASATCPKWLRFIRQITCNDKPLAAFLCRAVGYTLFGHALAQVFFVLDGTGSNGKGTLLRMLAAVLGPYAGELPPNIMTNAYSGNANASTPALAFLKGLRLAMVCEMPTSRALDTTFIKQFSGGDQITARLNYGDLCTFKPEGKLWVSTNDMPEIPISDKAMWRRVVPVPFNATFDDSTRDDSLEIELLKEKAGILNWALAGAKEYAKAGKLVTCEAVEVHKRSMKRESDSLSAWLQDACRTGDEMTMQASTGYASYQAYAKRMGRNPIGQKAFRMRLEKKGFARKQTSKYNCYLGLELLD